MALLTAEDVLNKAFSKTKYREGFDQDEVDDFLDEVANAIAALTAERDELANRLAQGAGAPAVVVAGEAAPVTGGSLLAAATDPNPPSATSMIAMAQKLHDEYVEAGEAERDKILEQARSEADELLRKAEADAKKRIAALEAERAEAERAIDDLRRFERDYRNHLQGYLGNLLGDLEHNSSRASGPALGTGLTPVVETAAAEPAAPPAKEAPAAPPAEVAPVAAAPEAAAPVAAAPEAAEPVAPAPAEVTVPEWPAAPAAPQWPSAPASAAPAGTPEADLELTQPTPAPSEPFPGATSAPADALPEWPAAPQAPSGTLPNTGENPFAPVNPQP